VKRGAAVVLAAGEGKRMRSPIPKVLHPLAGRPLIAWVLDAARGAGLSRFVIVVGRGGEEVAAAASGPGVGFVVQHERKGTGHAVQQAEPLLGRHDGPLVILSGDVPLIRAETIGGLLAAHEAGGATATVVTAEMPDPTGYGRIVKGESGLVDRIVEEKDASEEERAIREINSGTYCFDARVLFEALPSLRAENASGEYYLTDTIAVLRGRGLPVRPFPVADRWEIFGINTPAHLEQAAAHLAARGGGRKHG